MFLSLDKAFALAQILKDSISVKDLLGLIPDESFTSISRETNSDYQVKKLFSRNLFYLLLYGLMESNRVTLRSLEEVYKTKKFKFLFNLNQKVNIKFNTISTRLSNMNISFFERIYQDIYSTFSSLIPNDKALGYKITRVDSTMVCEAANKIEEGMILANQHGRKKHIKYTIALTDLFPSSVEVFTQQAALSEEIAIPAVIFKNIDKKVDNIFVFDRGMQSRKRFCELDNEDYSFVTRLSTKSRYQSISETELPADNQVGNLAIEKDEKVYLYSNGKKYNNPFRLIRAVNDKNDPVWLLTNRYDLSIQEIVEIYRRRWDIEVFFRFIKQELNFKHFMSTNINGIKIILYMTLILAMLILIYKKLNEVGYRIAKLRFYYELEDFILEMTEAMIRNNPEVVLRL